LNLPMARHYALETLKQRPGSLLAWRSLALSMLGKRVVSWAREKRRAKIAAETLRQRSEMGAGDGQVQINCL